MEKDIAYMKEQFEAYGFHFSELQIGQFYQFYLMLIEKNKVMNLTGITEFTEVVEKHFIDSILLSKAVDCNQPCKLIDLGTGAGFPGIPLKIAFPEMEILLMDSLNKRILFLDEVIEALKLQKIETKHARAEELARDKKYRESFDLCVSRAVANLSTLSEYCIPFVKKGGFFVSYKSAEIEEEVASSKRALKILGGGIKQLIPFTLKNSDSKRTLVVIHKVKDTPGFYPRKSGIPSKEPLK